MDVVDKHKLSILQVLEDHGNKSPTLFDIKTDQNHQLNSVPLKIRKELCGWLCENGYIDGDNTDTKYKINTAGLRLREFFKLQEDNENALAEISRLSLRDHRNLRLIALASLVISLLAFCVQIGSWITDASKENNQSLQSKTDTLIYKPQMLQLQKASPFDSPKVQVQSLKKDSCD